ncbi:helix-turn-helix transcriptional regulator [Kitasatospora sp. NPDC101183]|uniref:helix-turn-helix transcriptional regulator n=1 Tax=Kitasatospora sp. NPDC101183 TaxID=3364100 RepID=UPI003805D582
MAVKRERLARRRKDAGHTQETLAEALGVHRSTVVRWERGQGEPQPWMWVKLARLLKISTTELRMLFSTSDAPAAATASTPISGEEEPSLPTRLPALGDAAIKQPGPGYLGQEASAAGSSMALMGGEIRVGCRTSDGRIIFVTMPRRTLLRSAAAAAGTTLITGTAGVSTSKPLLSPDLHPVENLRRMRRSLVECDNVLGPRDVIASAQDHLRLIQQLCHDALGRDRLDLMKVQAEYAEFCSWLYQDSGDQRAALSWADQALDWSNAAGDHDLTVYITARKAQLAGDMKKSLDAVDLAESARRIAAPGSRLIALALVYEAHGYALRGDELTCQRAYDKALELVADAKDAPVTRGRWLEAAYVEAQRARSLSVLGQYEAAVSGFDQSIRALPASFRRDRGVYLARSAGAQLRAIGPEKAATTATEALSVAVATGSGRIFGELAMLDGQLQRWAAVAEVRQFRQALDSVMLHEV